MFNIVICDDNPSDLVVMEKAILKSKEYSNDMAIYKFLSGFEFIETKKVKADLLILDMQMPGMSGFETATEVRTFNEHTVICFASAVVSPEPQHFSVQPYRYILKGESSEKIEETIDSLLIEMKRRGKSARIEASADGRAILLEPEEILYLEKLKRGTGVILSKSSPLYNSCEKLVIRENLAELEKNLKSQGFARPHSSYLVNVKKVRAVDNCEIILENGEHLSITRSCKDEFHKAFSEYFSRKYRRG